MSIRRKSTAHDLATLRLHPDGSRVQQSSVNARLRRATTTVVDPRGNWIAKDAGGKCSVKIRRKVASVREGDEAHGSIGLSNDEEARGKSKGKQRARDDQTPQEDTSQEPESKRLSTRTRQRLSFMDNLSFLDPPPVSVSSLEQDNTDQADATESRAISFPDPAPDLLKSIHHFASCYYRERGQLFDSSGDYRGRKRERYKKSQENVHIMAANTLAGHDITSGAGHTETEDESLEEDEKETIDIEDGEQEGLKSRPTIHEKDMYKAFDGSALLAIGIVLQEYVAHTLPSATRTSEERRGRKRKRVEEDDPG